MLTSWLLCAALSGAVPTVSTQAAALPALPPEAAPDRRPLTEILVLAPVGVHRRGPFHADPVQTLIARGVPPQPQSGTVQAVGGGRSRTWTRLVNDAGSYADPALDNGWAFARLTHDTPGVYLLDAAGHAAAWIDGDPRAGDPYGLGWVRAPVHVRRDGTTALFKAGRGELRAALVTPPAPVFLESIDATLPDLVRGEPGDSLGAIVVVNATTEPQANLVVRLQLELGSELMPLTDQRLPVLVPLETRKQSLPLPLRMDVPEGLETATLIATLARIEAGAGGQLAPLHQERYTLQVRDRAAARLVGFQSMIDESAQVYALVPPAPGAPAGTAPAALLSLHGASVEARRQAAALTPRTWALSVAPTNRRPYGFDWEDWGRLDALEALFHAAGRANVDPRRLYVTGHSMGGHGAWLLGAQMPGLFAALAPVSGWRDFWSYSGAWDYKGGDGVPTLLARAANVSRLEPIESNLAGRGVYVLHGSEDDNVPVLQARAMRERLATFHADFAYREIPGAGHWWGDDAVDDEELHAFLERRSLPVDERVTQFEFTTVNPGVSGRMHWLQIEAQHHALAPSRVEARMLPDRRRFVFKTQNTSRLWIDLSRIGFPQDGEPATMPAGEDFAVFIDGAEMGIEWPAGARELRLFQRIPGGPWEAMGPVAPRWKNPQRAGPFKEAFKNRMVFVYGTQGEPEAAYRCFAKARYDLEVWRYRANGSALLVSDREFLAASPQGRAGRNVILYGNADENAAWSFLPADCPFEVRNGLVRVGELRLERDDLGMLFTFPLDSGPFESAAVVCGSGPTGMRLTEALPYFTSGASYPDWTVFDVAVLESGPEAVLGAGFLGYDWSLDRGQTAWAPSVLEKSR
ncbi:MAG TPA: prolyl oligopeptidase family serine peptidase [Planctomycetota bacterium]|nr:prolyl oligopeptidase family serine peptidase [Planctomycetota bacterium]